MKKLKQILFGIVASLLLISPFWIPAVKEAPGTPAELPETAPTPELTESPIETEAPLQSTLTLRINEAMSSNKATLAVDNNFPDWIELYNYGEEAVALGGCILSCGSEQCELADKILPGGAYCLLFCGKDGGEDWLPAALSAKGELLRLWESNGTLCDTMELPALEADQSCGVNEEGEAAVMSYPSPGYENTREGYCAFQRVRQPAPNAPAIAEVMVYNEQYLPVKDEYYDWIELYNPTEAALELSDFCVSDKGSERLLYRLPTGQLQPGERIVLLCDGDRKDREGFAPFSLASDRETLYLSRADGSLCDYAVLHDIPTGASMGREEGENGFFFFAQPTPGSENGIGKRFVAEKPVSVTADGVFNGEDPIQIQLSADGEIRYTTDGTVPTSASALYTGPIPVNETSVLRAVCFREDSLPSRALSLSYFINENHSLPVLSVVCDPDAIFGPLGIHTNPLQDWEIPCSVAFYEEDGSFCLDAGLKMHGGTSRFHMKKKSFKLNFKPRYDGQLHYRLFETDVEDFSSILIRSAQETDGLSLRPSTYMRDALIHKVAVRYFPGISSQDCRYCILYINGEYRGIYNLREAHSVEHFANHYNTDPDNLLHWKLHWGNTIAFDKDYYDYEVLSLANDENFAGYTKYLDLESIMDWLILQAYNGNLDANSPNMRFYWSKESQKLYYALVDLDMGMFEMEGFPKLLHSGYPFSRVAVKLLKNDGFRAMFAEKIRWAAEGPLSDESYLALIDEFADQLRPEIPRDRALWGGDLDEWETKVQELRDYVLADGGRARLIISTLSWSAGYTPDEMAAYFPDEMWAS